MSCSKDASLVEVKKNSDVFVENGVLNIKNQTVFEKLIIENSKKSLEELKEWQDSLGFESYQVFYNDVFTEYEDVIENATSIEPLEDFKNTFLDYVFFPGGEIDGLPNYVMHPNVDSKYITVSNRYGKVKIGGYLVDAKNVSNLKSASVFGQMDCSHKSDDGKRRMTIVFTPSPYYTWGTPVHVWHAKKVWFAWVAYKTQYWWQEERNGTVESTNADIPTDMWIYLHAGSSYLKIWNRGIGESNACDFDWFY